MLNRNDARKRTNNTPRKNADYKSRVINMTLTAPCESAILHEYMEQYQGLMTSMFERIGGLRQLVRRDSALLDMISLWHKTSLGITQKQLLAMRERRETLEMEIAGGATLPDINVPEDWKLNFVVTHPIAHDLVNLVKDINEEIKANEALFYAGLINEEAIERINNETVFLLSGVTDRIAKATRPGKRKAKGEDRMIYSAVGLAEHIRKGFRLDFADIPLEYADHVKEYEEETAAFKTLKKIDAPEEKSDDFHSMEKDNNKAADKKKAKGETSTSSEKVKEE